jgi:UDP-3-O-[3-hydroxymyristoyl] N-acetylglucosamine deacetylase/3-hydroxyacyl-[acyl-carrier-protein] dehydratase
MDIHKIMAVFPHRPPFSLIEIIVRNACCRNEKMLMMNENFFVGHLPEAPVMPGVLNCRSATNR